MQVLLSILGFVVSLSFLVIIHELGHFLTAKLFKAKVEEFGLGYPPKAKTLFRKWNTDFTLNWLPFGGFVRLAGEERTSDEKDSDDSQDMFYNKPVWQRITVLVAGAFVNFLFGVAAFSFLFAVIGIPELKTLDKGIVVTGISPDSPAEESGILPGDVITQVTFGDLVEPITSLDQFVEVIGSQSGSTAEVTYKRGFEEPYEVLSTSVYVRTPDEIPENDGAIGIGISDQIIEHVKYPWYQMPFRGAATGISSSFQFTLAILGGLGQMVGGIFSQGKLPTDVAGPAGIAYAAYKGNIFAQFEDTINFLGILSINLAVVNLLPIPALDGGRVFFIILEKLLGKHFKPAFEQYANVGGMALLLLLIVLVSFKDIGTIFTDAGWFSSFLGG